MYSSTYEYIWVLLMLPYKMGLNVTKLAFCSSQPLAEFFSVWSSKEPSHSPRTQVSSPHSAEHKSLNSSSCQLRLYLPFLFGVFWIRATAHSTSRRAQAAYCQFIAASQAILKCNPTRYKPPSLLNSTWFRAACGERWHWLLAHTLLARFHGPMFEFSSCDASG